MVWTRLSVPVLMNDVVMAGIGFTSAAFVMEAITAIDPESPWKTT